MSASGVKIVVRNVFFLLLLAKWTSKLHAVFDDIQDDVFVAGSCAVNNDPLTWLLVSDCQWLSGCWSSLTLKRRLSAALCSSPSSAYLGLQLLMLSGDVPPNLGPPK